MAEFAIFDKNLHKRARSRRRSSAAPGRSKSLPRTAAVVTYDQRPEERSRKESLTQVVHFEEPGRSSEGKLALVRHRPETDNVVQETRNDDGRGIRTVAFAQAAGILSYTLRKATLFCEDFEISFRRETQDLRYWSSRRTVDMLWRAKADWDGIPYDDSEDGLVRNDDGRVEHYNKHIALVRQAWEDLKYAQPVPRSEIKNVMRELRATMQQIDELWEIVRADRSQMRSLIYRLKDCMTALNDIEDVWNRPEYERSDFDRSDDRPGYDRREYDRRESDRREYVSR